MFSTTDMLNIIDDELNVLLFSKINFTLIPKKAAINAFKKCFLKDEKSMFDYLVSNSRSGGFQNKLFKEFVSSMEEELPFCFIKNKKQFIIKSILDPNINIFDGISTFSATVSDKLKVKNLTKEIYIGGRNSSIIQPFYIGKVIYIKSDNLNITNNITDYTFNYIKLRDILPGSIVKVKHYRVYPHYQMGAMTHINRAKDLIISRLKLI